MPYFLIGNLVAVFLAVYVFIEAETRGRIVVVLVMGSSFLVQELWPGQMVGIICSVVRVLFGIGCYLYIKLQAVF